MGLSKNSLALFCLGLVTSSPLLAQSTPPGAKDSTDITAEKPVIKPLRVRVDTSDCRYSYLGNTGALAKRDFPNFSAGQQWAESYARIPQNGLINVNVIDSNNYPFYGIYPDADYNTWRVQDYACYPDMVVVQVYPMIEYGKRAAIRATPPKSYALTTFATTMVVKCCGLVVDYK